VKWHYSGALKMLWGEDLRIDFQALGCAAEDVPTAVRCFFDSYPDIWGIDTSQNNLKLVSSTGLQDGRVVLRLTQEIESVPVRGADVLVTVSSDRKAITRVYSKYIRGLSLAVSPEQLGVAAPPTALSQALQQEIAQRLASQFVVNSPPRLVLLADQPHRSLLAHPAWEIQVLGGESKPYRVSLDISATDLLDVAPDWRSSAPVYGYTATTFMNYSSTTCSGSCTSPYNYCYEDPQSNWNKCVERCYADPDECSALGAGWACSTAGGDFEGQCVYGLSQQEGYVKCYDSTAGGWQDEYYYNHNFVRAIDTYLDWRTFLEDELERDSWDGNGGDLIFEFEKPCCNGTGGLPGKIRFDRWGVLDGSTNQDITSRYYLIGHEASHGMHYSIADGFLDDSECVSENMADLGGALFSRYELPTQTWTVSGYTMSAWQDKTCGLTYCAVGVAGGPLGHMPYSQRSRYDLLRCTGDWLWTTKSCTSAASCAPEYPYYLCVTNPDSQQKQCVSTYENHNNGFIWMRFPRVLAEGSGTFTRDGNNETLGFTFSGVGNATTFDIVYEAWTNLATTTTQLELAELLVSSGGAQSPSKATEVRYALGSIGYPGMTTAFGGVTTDRTPKALRWEDWTASSTKNFYVFKANGATNYDITVRYHDGSAWTSFTFGANTADSPTTIVYNGYLHIFWRDRTTNAIKMRYYNTSLAYSSGDLSALGLSTDGPFDATIFKGDLYLGYVRPGGTTLTLSRCTEDTYGCSAYAGRWYQYGSAYYKDLGYYTTCGAGLVAADGLNGAPSGEFLYALSSYSISGADFQRLRVLRIDTDATLGNVVKDYRWMSKSFPVYKADDDEPRGLDVRDSAFSDAGKYLYLVWNAPGEDRLYASILQNWTDGGNSDSAWFTRPVAMGEDSGEATTRGAAFWRHDSSLSARYIFTATSASNAGKYTVVWARY